MATSHPFRPLSLALLLGAVVFLALWGWLARADGSGDLPRVAAFALEEASQGDAGAVTLGAEVSSSHVAAGATLVYTVTLGNTTTITPITVTMTDTLPPGLTLLPESVWSSVGTASIATDTVTWTGQLEPSTTVTVGLAALASRGATVVTNTIVADAGPYGRLDSAPLVTTVDPWRTLMPVVMHQWQACILDDFTHPNSGWPTGETSAWTVAYAPAGYTMRATQASALLAVTRGDWVPHERFDMEVRVRTTPEGRGTVGLIYRLTGNWTTFETLEIDPIDQAYALFHYYDGQWHERKSGQLSAIVPDGANTLRVEWDYSFQMVYPSAQYSAYINGVQVYSSYYRLDDAPPPYGFGLIATSFTEGFTGIFEQYQVLPDGCGSGDSAMMTVPQGSGATFGDGTRVGRPEMEVMP